MTAEEEAAWWDETRVRLIRAMRVYILEHEIDLTSEVSALELLTWCVWMRDRPKVLCVHCRHVITGNHKCARAAGTEPCVLE